MIRSALFGKVLMTTTSTSWFSRCSRHTMTVGATRLAVPPAVSAECMLSAPSPSEVFEVWAVDPGSDESMSLRPHPDP